MRCDGIGDLVNSIPAIRAIRTHFDKSVIDLVVGSWTKDIAEMIPFVDEVLIHAPWGYRKLRATSNGESILEDFSWARQMNLPPWAGQNPREIRCEKTVILSSFHS